VTAQQSSLPGPLAGLRVIELADCIGQWGGKLLADLGADVIKVEPPGGVGERQVGPFYQDQPDPNRSLYFWHYNTSKRGVTLDLEQEQGRELFRRLVDSADILLETMPPGRMAELGLGYESLSAAHPGLIMCSLTPFGQDGPWRDYKGADLVHLAGGGQMAGAGYDPVDDPEQQPIAPGGGNAWHMASHYACVSILTAVYYRNVTGEGQYLDVSVHESCAITTEMHVPIWIYTGQVVQRQTARHAGVRPTPPTQLPTADGRYVNGGGGLTAQRFKPFVQWMDSHGKAGDLKDPKYLDPQVLQENQPKITEQVQEFVASITADEAFNGAQKAGLPWGAVRSTDELLDDDHFRSRGFFVDVEHPELGKSFTYPGPWAIYPKSPLRISRRAPLLGEDNAAVYGEIGVDSAALEGLRSAGVV
jgi:benzylsuccinate CoA-transferase BbsE subunit